MAHPLRIGILGTAKIARAFIAGVAASEKVTVTAVAGRTPDTTRAFAEETGVERVLPSYDALLADPDIDAIYNPLPNSLHAEWSIRAAEAGKHVLCEKPLAVTTREAEAMFDAARRGGVRLVEAFPYRSQPQTLKLKELLNGNTIGPVRLVRASFGFTIADPANIRFDPALGGGALYDGGVYPVNLVRMIAGTLPSRVHAIARWTDRGVDRSLVASLEFPDGLLAQISCGFNTAVHRHALIAGENGVIETSFANHFLPDRPATLSLKRGVAWDAPTATIETPPTNGFLAEAESFSDFVGGGRWNGTTEAESLDTLRILEAILESARRDRTVSLNS
jgi:predicted dehydrogenase